MSIRFLIKLLFFEKSHFLHPHAQKISQKLTKSFTFCLQKIGGKKQTKFFFFEECFHMAPNDSKWVQAPPDPKTSFGSPHAPYGHIKNFTKSIFGLENAFLSKIQRTIFFPRLCFMTNQVRGRKYRTKWKNLLIRFLIKQLFFEKSHFLHPRAQKTSQKERKSFTLLEKIEKYSKFER